jgi:uncharacterized protein YqjF (DUF2071 family)
MYQEWYHLLFVHWEVPAEPLQALLPPGLDLDTYEGRAYVGLVPFTMRGVRPRGLPSVPYLSNFHETNVRTYVHRDGRDPGVWFFSLDAANPVAVALARGLFGLPYYRARMCLEADPGNGHGPALTYVSERPGPARRPTLAEVRARVVGPVEPAGPGSLEEFLVERYLLYSTFGGQLRRGQVHHAPYPLQRAEVDTLDETLLAAAGIRRPDSEPLVHYAAGVRVEVFGLTPA